MRITGSIALDGLTIEFKQGSGTSTTLQAGSPVSSIIISLPSSATTLVGTSTADTLTNKTINASNNTISNLTTGMLAAGVLNTSTSLTGASDTQVPSALATKTYADNAASGALATKADKTTTISAGTGLTGGGDLSANRTISMADTTVSPGTYGSATDVGSFTVDAQGRLTSASNTSIQIAESQVTNLVTDLAAKADESITISAGTGLSGGGDLSADRTISLANTAVTPGSYGSATETSAITVDAQGRLTAASSTSIQIAESQVTNLVTDLSNKQPLDADLTALAGVSTAGLLARTGAGTADARTLTGTANRISVTNGDGVSGNPTLDIGSDVVTLTGTQVLTNKDIDGGTASNTSRFTVPKDTYANLSALTRKEGTLLYATDLDTFFADDGSTLTAVGSGSGSGSGALNIVDNPSATSATTGWTAATNYTVSRDTSNSPLAGVVDTCFAISTTTASSETSTSGVYAASLACPAAIRSTKLQLSMYVTVPASSLGVWRVSVYNSSGTRVSLSSDSSSVTTLPSGFTGQFNCTFDADTGATYTLSITQTTRTSANTLYVTNIVIGNGIITQGAAISGWQSFTPTGSWTSNTTYTGRWRRVGSQMEIQYQISLSGAPTATQLGVNLPTGYTLDTTGIAGTGRTGNLAEVAIYRNGVYGFGWGEYDASVSQSLKFRFMVQDPAGTTNSTSAITSTSPSSWANLDYIGITARVPIAEWSGNGTVNLGPGAQVEYAYTTDTWDGTGSTTAYGPSGQAIAGNLASTSRTKTITWQYPIQAGDIIQVEIDSAGTGRWVPIIGTYSATSTLGIQPLTYTTSGTGANSVGVVWRNTGTNTTEVVFGRYYAASLDGSTVLGGWSDFSATSGRWRVRKSTASAPVGFGLAGTDGSSGLYKAGQAPGLVTGATVATGYIGEVVTSASITATALSTSYANITNASLALTPGVWQICYSISLQPSPGSTVANETIGSVQLYNNTGGSAISSSQRSVAARNPASASFYVIGTAAYSTIVNISSATTYTIQGKRTDAAGTGTCQLLNSVDYTSSFYAVRIA